MNDRLPPHSEEAEQGILGCCLDDPTLVPDLRLEWFYDLRCRTIAESMLGMSAASKPIDPATVCAELRAGQKLETVGGAVFISELPDKGPSPANFPHWQSVLQEQATLRRILAVSADYTRKVYEKGTNCKELLDSFEHDVMSIRQREAHEDLDIRSLVLAGIGEFEKAFKHKGQVLGIQTGFSDIDRLTNGFRPGQLIVIAARPSIGKTSLAMNIAEHVSVDLHVPVGIFSLEMTAQELVLRMQCCRARVDLMAASRGELSELDLSRLNKASTDISRAPLFICDQAGLTVSQLAAKSRRWIQLHDIKLLVVDYLGLLRGGGKFPSRYEEITCISGALKKAAKDLRLPILCLAQLNRCSERENRPPFLSDLRDSGAIEQDADLVGFLYRPEESNGDIQKVDLLIVKQRNGPTGKVDLEFFKRFTRFQP